MGADPPGLLGNATTDVPGVLLAGAEVRHGVGDGALHGPQAAIAQDHDKATQPSLRLAYRDGAERAPLDRCTLAGRAGHREQGGPPPGSDGSHRRFDQRIATVNATRAQTRADLGRRRGRVCQHADARLVQGIERAGALMWPAGPHVLVGPPGGHGAGSEHQRRGDRRGAQSLVGLEGCALANTVLINHDRVSARWLKRSLIAMGVSAAVILGAPGARPRGGGSRART
jgi:hypothetical protein